MANTVQLLSHIRRALASISAQSHSSDQRAVLAAVDAALNELMLEQSPTFYLDYLSQGETLLNEGIELARQTGSFVAPDLAPSSVTDAARSEAISAAIDRLHERMLPVVAALDEGRSPEEKAYLVRLSRWEGSLHEHRLQAATGPVEPDAAPLTRERVLQYLKERFPQDADLSIATFAPLEGGFSKQTILFETRDSRRGAQSLVMRAETAHQLLCFEGSDVTQEFYLIQLMREAGVPVAEPLWLESDRTRLGARFIVSRRAVGKTYGGNLGSDEELSDSMLQSIVSTMIQMHAVQIDPSNRLAQQSHLKEWLHMRTVTEVLQYAATEYLPRLARLAGIALTPQLLRGLKWLQRNVPECADPPVVVHLDFALNNLILDARGITAVLDWESSRMGDPAEDLTWTQQNLREYLTMPQLLEQYEAATGRRISPFRLAYARVSKCVLNAITCLAAMHVLDHQADPQIKLAILGYRYMALFGNQFNELIEEAERLR